MSIRLDVTGLYIDPNFEHKQTKYIISKNYELNDIIDSHTSENNDELYSYTFENIEPRHYDKIYYMIKLTLVDSDNNEYELSDGVLESNVSSQTTGETSMIKTPKIIGTLNNISGHNILNVEIIDSKTYDDEIIKSELYLKDLTGETLYYNNKKENIDTYSINCNSFSNKNFIIESRFSSKNHMSLSARKLILNKKDEDFLYLISKNYIYNRVSNTLFLKVSNASVGMIDFYIYDKLTRQLIADKHAVVVQRAFETFKLIFKTNFIINARRYTLVAHTSFMDLTERFDEIELIGIDQKFKNSKKDIYYEKFNLTLITNNRNPLINSVGYTKFYKNSLVGIVGHYNLTGYDDDNKVMNKNEAFSLGLNYFTKTNFEYDNKNIFIHFVNNLDGELSLKYVKISDNESKTLDVNKNILDNGDHYIDLFEIDSVDFTFIMDDGSGFKIYSQDRNTGDLNEVSDTIDDLSEYRDLIDVEDSIVLSTITIGDYYYAFARGLLVKIKKDTYEVEKYTSDDTNIGNIRLYASNENIIICYNKDLTNTVEILEFNTVNKSFGKTVKTDFDFNKTIHYINNNDELCFLVFTNTGHKTYKLI